MGMTVVRMLESHTPHLVDFDFTAHMEARLDEIARGEADYATYLQRFYYDGFPDLDGVDNIRGLHGLLEEIRDNIDPAKASSSAVGSENGEEVLVKIGRYGTFIKHGDRTASLPDDLAPDELDLSVALEILEAKEKSDRPIGKTASGVEIFVRKGRFGAYIQAGEKDTDSYQTVSLSKGMGVEAVDETLARRQLELPRDLGPYPDNNEPVMAHVGRYGDYIRCGKETRNLDGKWAIDVTFDDAVALLKKPKVRGKTMLNEIGKRESDGVMIELWRGRYGPYVTDGTYNKTLGDVDPSTVTVELATTMLAEAKVAKEGTLLGVNSSNGNEVRLMKGRFGPYVTDGEMNASLPKGTETDAVDLRYAIERILGYGKPVKKKAPKSKKAAATKKTTRKKKSTKKERLVPQADPCVKLAAGGDFAIVTPYEHQSGPQCLLPRGRRRRQFIRMSVRRDTCSGSARRDRWADAWQ